jgi:hypothetical protein
LVDVVDIFGWDPAIGNAIGVVAVATLVPSEMLRT